jgi:hypothetical protein
MMMMEQVNAPPEVIPPTMPLWVNQRRGQFRWEVDNGAAIFDFPHVMKPEEVDELEKVLALCVKAIRRNSDAIAAQVEARKEAP